jgi:hypothetical protein
MLVRYNPAVTLRNARTLCFVMLNPSVAGADSDDPTVRRCWNFACRWGFHALEVVNIFGLISTNPKALKQTSESVGASTDVILDSAMQSAHSIVCAWGAHGKVAGRGREVLRRFITAGLGPKLFCFGVTAGGEPLHPLYLPNDAKVYWLMRDSEGRGKAGEVASLFPLQSSANPGS